VLMRGILISTIIQAVYERAYERDSHKHANTSIYKRAYERDSHKHDHTSKYMNMSVLMRGILISTLTQLCLYERDSHKHANTKSL
jgi:hypothetical protein